MSRDLTALFDIAEAIGRALHFAQGMDRDAFLVDDEKRWAVYSQIIIIGEAAGRVSAEFRQTHTDIPWRSIIGMRHRLVHGYDDINWTRVWETIAHDLPALLDTLKPLLPPERG